MEYLNDWAYLLERTFPQLHGAGSFVLGAVALMALFVVLYFATRRQVHLLSTASIALYLLPFIR